MSDYEIEYLDEDEEMVQKCVQLINKSDEEDTNSLLVRRSVSSNTRKSERDRKRNAKQKEYEPIEEHDSDFDPVEAERQLKRPKKSKKPTQTSVKQPSVASSTVRPIKPFSPPSKLKSTLNYQCKIPIRNAPKTKEEKIKQAKLRQAKLRELKLRQAKQRSQINRNKIIETLKNDEKRKLHDEKLHDFEDTKYFSDIKLLNNGDLVTKWNQLCVKQDGEMKDAKNCRSVQYLRKVRTNIDDEVENVIRLHYEYRADSKLFNFQGILPRFRPVNAVEVKFSNVGRAADNTCTLPTILTKEKNDKSEILVAYCPKDFRVMIFEGCAKPAATEKCANAIRVLMSCKMCVKCYQYSWRGSKSKKGVTDIKCTVCESDFTSAYNLLAHIRKHKLKKEDKIKQNKILSKIMGYHYNCRLCKFNADSIPELRRHLKLHKSLAPFYCEVGKHFTT